MFTPSVNDMNNNVYYKLKNFYRTNCPKRIPGRYKKQYNPLIFIILVLIGLYIRLR